MGYLGLIYALLYLPIVVLICYSFNDTSYSLVWHGATLKWYRELGSNDNLWLALSHSFLVGICASVMATVLGMLGALSLYRYKFFGKKVIFATIFILIILPDLLLGVSLLVLYSVAKIPLGFSSILIAHVSLCLPFALITIYSRLSTFDSNIFMAAKDLGATEWQTFHKVVLPNIWTAIVGACLLSFTLSFDDVVISYFVSGPNFSVLPLKIYAMVRLGMKPEINALCSIIFVFTLTVVSVSQWLLRKKS